LTFFFVDFYFAFYDRIIFINNSQRNSPNTMSDQMSELYSACQHMAGQARYKVLQDSTDSTDSTSSCGFVFREMEWICQSAADNIRDEESTLHVTECFALAGLFAYCSARLDKQPTAFEI
jgi:hypothetical protein